MNESRNEMFYDETIEDPAALIALMDAGASESELMDVYHAWATTEDHVDVVWRLYNMVSTDFKEIIMNHVADWAEELSEDGWDDDENAWLELLSSLS